MAPYTSDFHSAYDPVTGTIKVNTISGSNGFTSLVVTTPPSVVTTLTSAAGKLGGYALINLAAGAPQLPLYLLIWDTTGAVTIGTTVPTIIIPLPGNASQATSGSMANLDFSNGAKITNGIKYCFSTLPGTAGATAYTTALGVVGTIWYV
jgi:hypothetical protein